jgi:hypothetical protein
MPDSRQGSQEERNGLGLAILGSMLFALSHNRATWQRDRVMASRWTCLFAALLMAACSRTGQTSARGSGGMGGAHGGASGSAKGGTDGPATSVRGGDSGARSGGAGSLATGGAATGGAATGGAAANGGVTGHGGVTDGAAANGGIRGDGSATDGSRTTDAATDGAAGSGETAGGLEPCNSSDGSGCSDDAFCMDTRSDSCSPDYMKDCTGFCAGRRRAVICGGLAPPAPCPDGFACLPDARTYLDPYPVSICVGADTRACTAQGDCPTGFSCVPGAEGSRCSPDKTVCEDYVTCPMEPPPRCPRGYARSTPDNCYGPCVPVELCGCTTNTQCGFAAAACDRKQERCYLARSPEPRCQLPADFASCTLKAAYAFIDGVCQLATSGCAGNDNRFSTLEECRARCEGVPGDTACPEGQVEGAICIGCGGGGGCIRYVDVCTTTCATRADCPSSDFVCYGGYCENGLSCV